jgi:hypothetical protein
MMTEYEKYSEMKKKTVIKKEADYFIPICINMKKDSILNDTKRMEVSQLVPIRFKQRNWVLIYSTFEHGTLMDTMYRKMQDGGPFLIIIFTVNQESIGAFLDVHCLEDESKYYGGGETFVFHWKDQLIKKYKWTKANDYLISSNGKTIYIGGGITSKPSIYISEDLLRGSSGDCETFNSPSLTSENDFEIFGLQVFKFEFKKK